MAKRGGGSGMLEARAQRLPSTLASIEAGNSSKADADDASLIEPATGDGCLMTSGSIGTGDRGQDARRTTNAVAKPNFERGAPTSSLRAHPLYTAFQE